MGRQFDQFSIQFAYKDYTLRSFLPAENSLYYWSPEDGGKYVFEEFVSVQHMATINNCKNILR